HSLTLWQQPKHSRMCGFGEKVDRRPVDPPPIIQLEIKMPQGSDESWYLYNPYYFMYATLLLPDSDDELHLLRDGKTRSTTGSIVSSLYRLKDVNNKEGAFFVFPDLSVRLEGRYRLKFSLFEIVNTEIYFCTSICSDVFHVYAAKKFPGMEESTFLSKMFAEQGLKIRIRKDSPVPVRQQFPPAPPPEYGRPPAPPTRPSYRPDSYYGGFSGGAPRTAPPASGWRPSYGPAGPYRQPLPAGEERS
ncbi:velvet factor-domain-containing protein, partial [Zopfochytrium polystomum]